MTNAMDTNIVNAFWFDRLKSKRTEATVWIRTDDSTIHARNKDGRTVSAPLRRVEISSRLGDTPRTVCFPDGTQLIINDNDGFAGILAKTGNRQGGLLHCLERNLAILAVSVTLGLAVGATLLIKGVPLVADTIAWKLPIDLLDDASNRVLEEFDAKFLESSQLSDEDQREIHTTFDRIANDLPWERDFELLLRNMDANGQSVANAFALPNGKIIVLDGINRLAEGDELVAVLAHEIEHVRKRHSLRSLVQAAAIGFAFGLITGDISGLVSVPIILTQMNYSREHEREADCLSYLYLKDNGLDTKAIGSLMSKIEGNGKNTSGQENETGEEERNEASDNADDEAENGGQLVLEAVLNILSTHPDSKARTDPENFCNDFLREQEKTGD